MFIKERIKEIIAYLLDQDMSDSTDPESMSRELEERGYSPDEIRHAMSMLDLEPKLEDDRPVEHALSGTRVLGESEKMILSTEAQGYLLEMLRLRILSEAQLGLIIESANLEYLPPISLDEIKELTARYVAGSSTDHPTDPAEGGRQVH